MSGKGYLRVVAGIITAVLLLGGCKETPDDVIVKQKGGKAVAGYEEEEEGLSAERVDGGDNVEALRQRLGVPERYQNMSASEDGKVTVATDAEIELPDTPAISAIGVTAVPLTQKWMEDTTNGLFPKGRFYESKDYYTMTKSFIEQKIGELKGFIAQGNLDPYQYGMDEEGKAFYDIYKELEKYENAYANAPETPMKKEIDVLAGAWQSEHPRFDAIAETEDGTDYSYSMSTGAGDTILVKANRIGKEPSAQGSLWWKEYGGHYSYTSSDSSQNSSDDWKPSKEALEETIGITREKAAGIADGIVASMGIEDLAIEQWDYALQMNMDMSESHEVLKSGYVFYYTRRVKNCPVTYTMAYGGGLEDMESTVEPWCYERLDIVISEDGLEDLYYANPYQMGETQVEQVKLLSFDEIAKTYEQMMQFEYSGYAEEGGQKIRISVDRVTLGYTRIYNPSESSDSGILVPVWDFFGEKDVTVENDDFTYQSVDGAPLESRITINAVDGTVIDRELGY